jgi:hypothetical protein
LLHRCGIRCLFRRADSGFNAHLIKQFLSHGEARPTGHVGPQINAFPFRIERGRFGACGPTGFTWMPRSLNTGSNAFENMPS